MAGNSSETIISPKLWEAAHREHPQTGLGVFLSQGARSLVEALAADFSSQVSVEKVTTPESKEKGIFDRLCGR